MDLHLFCFFFFKDTATTEIYTRPYTLSLHDALPISSPRWPVQWCLDAVGRIRQAKRSEEHTSELQSHGLISYAVFCLKKKKTLYSINPITLYKMKKQSVCLVSTA